MHEYSIVSSLLNQVEAQARRASATAVASVTVHIGALSGVDSRLLATAFDTFKERTLCAGATLQVEDVPAKWRCPRCGAEPGPTGALRCVSCDRPLELVAGDEIVLTHLELEVPDHVH